MLTDVLRPVVPRGARSWLRQWDRERRFTRGVKSLRQHDTFIPLSVETLDDLLYGWNNPWSLREELICQLWDDAWHTTGPILECGSGLSTILLAAVAEKRNQLVIALEHDLQWHQRMARVLGVFGMAIGEFFREESAPTLPTEREAEILRLVRTLDDEGQRDVLDFVSYRALRRSSESGRP